SLRVTQGHSGVIWSLWVTQGSFGHSGVIGVTGDPVRAGRALREPGQRHRFLLAGRAGGAAAAAGAPLGAAAGRGRAGVGVLRPEPSGGAGPGAGAGGAAGAAGGAEGRPRPKRAPRRALRHLLPGAGAAGGAAAAAGLGEDFWVVFGGFGVFFCRFLTFFTVFCYFLPDFARFNPKFPFPGLVRAQPEGLQQLQDLGGLEALGGALQSPHPPLRARAAFLLHCLLREHPRLTGPLLQQGLVPRAAALLRSEHDGAHEHGLGVLCSLAAGSPEGLRECRDPALGLEQLLRQRREQLKGHDQFQEELEFCERLLQLCFETPPEESTMDR
uniref:HSPA (Hsp70) binding protein 1 n=1 Tax=Taeniopygia guttata TaxID=59729 RepID=A0A674HR04_TAEGU